MDEGTLEMLRISLEHVLTDEADPPLAERLAALGWDEALADDAPAALRVLFETKGTTLSGADALGPVLARAIAESVHRPELATAVVVLPESLHPAHLSTRLDAGRLVVAGVAADAPKDGLHAIVPVDGGASGVRLAVVHADGVTNSPLEATDPSLGLCRLRVTVGEADVEWIDGDASVAAWEAASAQARWALAAELVSIGRHVVAQAVDYTGQRKQYGRPIGSFQALQHRLAGAHASLVGASHAVVEAAATAGVWEAMVAKALAGRAAEHACTQAQQSYGAIGFTWEHEFHRYLRRTYVLDWFFGDWRTLEREIGAQLLAAGLVPKIGSL